MSILERDVSSACEAMAQKLEEVNLNLYSAQKNIEFDASNYFSNNSKALS